jgi:hypothetical protein
LDVRNPLALPLLIVSLVAGVEAVALLALVSRRPHAQPVVQQASLPPPPTQPGPQAQFPAPPAESAAPASAAPPTTLPASPSDGVARGRKGQRVESAGFGITVEEITDQPTYPNLLTLGPDARYLALLVVVDNNTGGNVGLYPAQFILHDEKGFEYDRGLPVKQPTLEWRTMGNRESIRGYIDFVVPKSAKGLTLIYSDVPAAGSKPIHIELEE